MANPIFAILAVPTIMAITAGSVILITNLVGEKAEKPAEELRYEETLKAHLGGIHNAKESVRRNIREFFAGGNASNFAADVDPGHIDDLISESKEYVIIESARVLKQHGKSDDEIKKLLSEKFLMSEDEIDDVLKGSDIPDA